MGSLVLDTAVKTFTAKSICTNSVDQAGRLPPNKANIIVGDNLSAPRGARQRGNPTGLRQSAVGEEGGRVELAASVEEPAALPEGALWITASTDLGGAVCR